MLLDPERCFFPYHCTCNAFFQCPPFTFAHHEKCWFCGRHMMASIHNKLKIVHNFHSGYFDCKSSFKQFLIRTTKHLLSDDKYISVVQLFRCSMHEFTTNNTILPYFNHNQSHRHSNRRARGLQPPVKDQDTLIEQSVTWIKHTRVVKEVVYETNKDSET